MGPWSWHGCNSYIHAQMFLDVNTQINVFCDNGTKHMVANMGRKNCWDWFLVGVVGVVVGDATIFLFLYIVGNHWKER
jgi:hypothetical protein